MTFNFTLNIIRSDKIELCLFVGLCKHVYVFLHVSSYMQLCTHLYFVCVCVLVLVYFNILVYPIQIKCESALRSHYFTIRMSELNFHLQVLSMLNATIPVFEPVKTFHALHCAANVIGVRIFQRLYS
jgi:hypothetical protein